MSFILRQAQDDITQDDLGQDGISGLLQPAFTDLTDLMIAVVAVVAIISVIVFALFGLLVLFHLADNNNVVVLQIINLPV